MKNKKWLFGAIVLLVVVLVWFLKRQPETKLNPSAETSAANSNVPSDSQNPEPTKATAGTNANTPPPPVPTATPQLSSAAAEEKLQAVIENKNAPIEFWGKVIDQNAAPLPGARIQSQIRHWDHVPGATSARVVEGNTTADADGAFHVGGSTGDDLTLKIQKEGYELEPNAKLGFGFNTADQISSDPNAPVVFKMWQTNVHEPLLTGVKSFHIATDGKPYAIDFAKGTIAETGNGDLAVWIKRPTQVSSDEKYNWSSEINVINGGLLEETNAASSMYSAPLEGYNPAFRYEQQLIGRQRGSTGTRRFFVKLKNGQYGRITIELIAPYNDRVPGKVELEYTVNPSGSRILR